MVTKVHCDMRLMLAELAVHDLSLKLKMLRPLPV